MPIFSCFPSHSDDDDGYVAALDPVSGVTVSTASERVYIKWTDPEDFVVTTVTFAEWAGTLLVRKAGSAPTSRDDGEVVIDSKTRNAYRDEAYCDSGLTNGTIYYYKLFPYSADGVYTDDEAGAFSATPNPVMYTVSVSVDPEGSGTVTGAGQYEEGSQATIAATATDGCIFTRWTVNGVEVGIEESYTFTVTEDVEVVAAFAKPVTLGPWIKTALPSSANWQSVTYGNGKFVAIAYNSNKAAYSTDGISWTAATLPSSYYWESVAYGDGKYVAIAGSSNNRAAYSTDGINWTAAYLPTYAPWSCVAYGDGKFIAVTSSFNSVACSTDGINWTTAPLPSYKSWDSITYGGGKFVTVAYNSDSAAYSTDGINWTATSLPVSARWANIAYGNGTYVAIADSGEAAYSIDGVNWVETTLPALPEYTTLGGVAYGNGRFMAAVCGSDIAAYSADGINWTTAAFPESAYWSGVAYGNEKFVTVSDVSSNKAAYCEFA